MEVAGGLKSGQVFVSVALKMTRCMEKQFPAYYCEDPAYYCEELFIDVVLPSNEIKMDDSMKWLIIGSPGVDGIQFKVRKCEADTAVYAYYPVDDTHILIADSAHHLIERWKQGKIKV